MPRCVRIHSPRRDCAPAVAIMGFKGSPAKRFITSDQAIAKPQLAGRKGAISKPSCESGSTQSPVAPRRGQDAPPRASTTASALMMRSPSGVTMRNAPSCVKPRNSWRKCSRTFRRSSSRNHARSRGEALKLLGKTRPLEPTNVSSPMSCAKRRKASGVKRSMKGLSQSRACA